MEKRNLPKIVDLYESKDLAIKHNELAILLNQEPKKEWVKEHPMVKGLKYLPIEVVEFLMTSIFLQWRVEIKDSKLIANSVVVTVRVHYQDPITGEMSWSDGIGATPVQTDKGAGATDFNSIKSNAIQIGFPAAKSYAVKDACELIGRLFGKDLNRKDTMSYDILQNRFKDYSMLDKDE